MYNHRIIKFHTSIFYFYSTKPCLIEVKLYLQRIYGKVKRSFPFDKTIDTFSVVPYKAVLYSFLSSVAKSVYSFAFSQFTTFEHLLNHNPPQILIQTLQSPTNKCEVQQTNNITLTPNDDSIFNNSTLFRENLYQDYTVERNSPSYSSVSLNRNSQWIVFWYNLIYMNLWPDCEYLNQLWDKDWRCLGRLENLFQVESFLYIGKWDIHFCGM